MISRNRYTVLERVHRLFEEETSLGASDAKFLHRFVAERNESSLGTLIRRHGPMVLGVCRRELPSSIVLKLVHSTLRSFQMNAYRGVASIMLAFSLTIMALSLVTLGQTPSPEAAPPKPSAPNSVLAEIKRESIPAYELAVAGAGDPADAPKELVAVLGDSRWKHGSYVSDVAFSPNGKWVASVGGDGTFRLWAAATGEERLHRHVGPALAGGDNPLDRVVFSPDGRVVAAGGSHRVVFLWQVPSGRAIREIRTRSNVSDLAFHPDGKRLVIGDDEEVAVWDVITGNRLIRLDEESRPENSRGKSPIAILPRDGSVAVGTSEGNIQLYEITTGKLLRTIPAHKGPLTALVANADGTSLISAAGESVIKVWNPPDGTLKQSLDSHWPRVAGLAIRPDGVLASTGDNGDIQYWSGDTGERLNRLSLPSGSPIARLAFSPDGATLAIGGQAVHLHDAQSGHPRFQHAGHQGATTVVDFGQDGNVLATGGLDRRVRIWDLKTRQERRSIEATSRPSAVLFANSQKVALFDRTNRESLKVCETESGKVLRQWNLWGDSASALSVSPDGRWLAAVSRELNSFGYITVYDLERQKRHGLVQTAETNPRFFRDGKRMVTAGQTSLNGNSHGVLTLWNVEKLEIEARFDNFEGMSRIRPLDISADNTTLAVAGTIYGPDDRSQFVVVLWDIPKRRRRLVLDLGQETVRHLAFAPDGRSLVTVDSEGKTLRIWDPRDGSLRQTIPFPKPEHNSVKGLAIAPDSLHVATAMANGTTYLLRIQPPREHVDLVAILSPGTPTPELPFTKIWKDLIGKDAPELEKMKGWILGEPVRLADLRGRFVLLHFWNMQSERRMPDLIRLHQQFARHGLTIIVVYPNHGRSLEAVQRTFRRLSAEHWQGRELPFRVLLDGEGATQIAGTELKTLGAIHASYRILHSRSGSRQYATNLLIDPQGRILTSLPWHLSIQETTALQETLGVKADPAPGREEFLKQYALSEHQVLKRIAPPFGAERFNYLLHGDPDFRGNDTRARIFEQKDGRLVPTALGGERLTLREFIVSLIHIKPEELEISASLGNQEVTGDWVYLSGSTPQERLAALQAILRTELGTSLTFARLEPEQEVIVTRGQFKFQPLPDDPEDTFVRLYLGSPPPPPRPGGPNMNTLGELLSWLSNREGILIINESENPGTKPLLWQSHLPLRQTKPGQPRHEVDPDLDQILAVITKQTSFQFERVVRKVPTWSVVSDR